MSLEKSLDVPEETEALLIQDGLYEVNPARMGEIIDQEKMSNETRHMIDRYRIAYLNYINDHFADKVLEPPAEYGEESLEEAEDH